MLERFNFQKILNYIAEHKIISLVLSFSVFLVCTVGFIQVADEITEGETKWFDEATLTYINSFSSAFWDTFFVLITQLGGVIGVIAITAGMLSLLTYRKKYKSALIIGAAVGGAAILNLVLKYVFERARPDLWEQLVVETSYSFPSGHAMISSALGIAIIIVFWKTRYRIAASIISISYILLVGFSRLYLGVHYPTDILAGWLVSGAWLVIVMLIVNSKYLRGKWLQLKSGHRVSR